MNKTNLFGNEITFADLCAGIGGFHQGIRAYASEVGIQEHIHAACEIDASAIATYDKNYLKGLNMTSAGDIKTMVDPVTRQIESKYENFDLLSIRRTSN